MNARYYLHYLDDGPLIESSWQRVVSNRLTVTHDAFFGEKTSI
jgi:hypothetical protein